MKKLFLLVVCFYPVFLFAQQQVVLKSGIQFEAYIRGVQNKYLFFYDEVKEIDSRKVDIMLIRSISGEFSELTIKKLAKKNPEIIFNSNYIESQNDNAYQEYNQNINKSISAGDHLVTAGTRYITGISLAIAGGTLYVVGATQNLNELSIAGGVIAVVGGIISVTGHFQLIKAGKKMNSDAVTLSPASQGIGMAINF